jgi:hypothetical protein
MLPTEYILTLYDTSGEHRPVISFCSATPFNSVHVGDRFDDHGWDRLDEVGVIASTSKPIRYTVHSIKHSVQETSEKLIVTCYLNLQPFSGASSPVW